MDLEQMELAVQSDSASRHTCCSQPLPWTLFCKIIALLYDYVLPLDISFYASNHLC